MKFPHLPEKKQKGRPFLVFAIGNKSLMFAVFEKEGRDELNVLTFGAKPISTISFEPTLQEAYSELQKEFRFNKVIFSLPTAIFRARISTYLSQRKNPKTSIGEKESEAIENGVAQNASKEMRESLSVESGILPEDLEAQNIKVLQRKIDGYGVPSLQGFAGSNMEFGVFGTFLLRPHTHTLQMFARRYGVETFTIVHLAEALENFSQKTQGDAVYIDIEDETTQIIVRKGGVLASIDSIPAGGDNFAEIFVESLGMSKNTAREFQERYFRRELSKELQGKIQTLLLPEVKNFAALTKKRLGAMEMSFPGTIRLFGAGSQARELLEVFDEAALADLAFLRTPESSFLFPKDTWNIRNFPYGADPRYTVLFLLAYAS